MNEVQIVHDADFRSSGKLLTSVFPDTVAPFREGVYLVKVELDKWMFAHYNLEVSETFYKARKQVVYVPGHWGGLSYSSGGAYMLRNVRDFKACYQWCGLAQQP